MRISGAACLVVALFLAAAPSAFAQASITGTVRDSSGGVLPGVTVEASSPALIEKTRTATTDGNGQYRIVDLRAGQYTVTFSLSGFSTVKRAEVALEGSFTATINIDMKVGELTETITVTGESPIVDVQSVRRQMVLDNDIISAIPSSRSYNNLIQLIPNSINQAGAPTDVQVVPGMVVFGGFGGRSNEGRVNVDGISVGSAFNGAGVSSYIADVANAREIAMITSGGLGETEGGGPSLNVLPKEGGNQIRGTFFGAGATSGMVGSNYTDELKQRGLTTPGVIRKVWDFNLGLGGPIAKERVWFYANLREEGSERSVPGMFANKNAGDPTKWLYVADTSRPAVLAASYRITALRITSQATPRKQVDDLLGSAAPVRRRRGAGILWQRLPQIRRHRDLRGIDRRTDAVRVCPRRARDGGVPRLRQSRLAGEVDVAGEQSAPAGIRIRHVLQPVRRRRHSRSPD
jgi:hypothetical protein